MRLYVTEGNWTTDCKTAVTWGCESIPYDHVPGQHFLSIAPTSSIKPLVGIITSEHKNSTFAGNKAAFQRIQLALQQAGGLSYVFTPSGWKDEKISGFVYDFHHKKWIQAHFPIPDVIYNRIPFRKHEEEDHIKSVKKCCHLNKIPFFNDSFLKKEQVFHWLSQNAKLLQHLPVTKKLSSPLDFIQMIETYNQVYLKPSKGKKGNGIIVIKRQSNNQLDVKTVSTMYLNQTKEKIFEEWILPNIRKQYIIQEAITPLKWDGARFDYRVLVHRKSHQEFIVSGIGVRQSQLQDVTTHVPTGGKIVPFHELPFPQDQEVIQTIAQEIGQTLSSHLHVGEFSIDLGKSENGHLFIFEVNSKPMVFDEDHIRRNGLENLLSYFRFLVEDSKE